MLLPAARLQLPFSRRLAWPTFSVRIAEAEALADPIGIVRKVPAPRARQTLAARVACLATRPRRLAPVACGRYTDRSDDADCTCSTDRAYRAH